MAMRVVRVLQLSPRDTTIHVVIHAKSTGQRIDYSRCEDAAAPQHPVATPEYQKVAAVAINAGDVFRSATTLDAPSKGEHDMRHVSLCREL